LPKREKRKRKSEKGETEREREREGGRDHGDYLRQTTDISCEGAKETDVGAAGVYIEACKWKDGRSGGGTAHLRPNRSHRSVAL